jgi:integrase
MASISLDPEGRRRILFIGADRVRRTIYLGRFPKRDAETIRVHVEAIVSSRKAGNPLGRLTADWLTTIGDELHGKLVAVHLAESRTSKEPEPEPEPSQTLKTLHDEFDKSKLKAKEATRTHWEHTWRNLREFFTENKDIEKITEADAGTWVEWLDVEQKLSLPTRRKRCGNAKQFFKFAVRKRLIPSNPFGWIKSSNVTNRTRNFFLTRDDAQKVLEVCPDWEWRLLFALSRYGGLRCPSEHLSLRWADVDWVRDRMLVISPKTEHHPGGQSRVIPIFPELRPFLEDARELAEPDAEHVIARYRRRNSNLATQLKRIIKRAGLRPWPKLFNNLRSTRQTELEESFPSHVVCAWLGNSQPIARKHYLQVTDDHFARALKPAQPAATHQTTQTAPIGLLQPNEIDSKGSHAVSRQRSESPGVVANAENQRVCGALKMGDAGLEHDRESSRKSRGRIGGNARDDAAGVAGRRLAEILAKIEAAGLLSEAEAADLADRLRTAAGEL